MPTPWDWEMLLLNSRTGVQRNFEFILCHCKDPWKVKSNLKSSLTRKWIDYGPLIQQNITQPEMNEDGT